MLSTFPVGGHEVTHPVTGLAVTQAPEHGLWTYLPVCRPAPPPWRSGEPRRSPCCPPPPQPCYRGLFVAFVPWSSRTPRGRRRLLSEPQGRGAAPGPGGPRWVGVWCPGAPAGDVFMWAPFGRGFNTNPPDLLTSTKPPALVRQK